MSREELFKQYQKELNSPMQESLNGFCDWLIERLNKFDVPANVKNGK